MEYLKAFSEEIEKSKEVISIINDHKDSFDAELKKINEKLKRYDLRIEIEIKSTKSRFMQKMEKMMKEANIKK